MHDLYFESEFGGHEAEHFEFTWTPEGPFSEAEEMELAAELLGVTTEAELDHFIGKMFKKAWGGIKKVAGGPLGGILKGIAKKALPFVGGALGSLIPIPGVGTAVGTALGTAASKLFEIELEGMSTEEAEFEVARRFVRLCGAAAKNAAAAAPGTSPQSAAQEALAAAAQQHAPGLLRRASAGLAGATPAGGSAAVPRGKSGSGAAGPGGRWVRKGNCIILLGV